MKQKFITKSEVIVLAIGISQLVIMLLPWLGICPPSKPTNLVGKFFNILFIKIPLIWIILFACFTFIIVSRLYRRKLITKEEKWKLSKEHYWVLLSLLHQPNRSLYRQKVEQDYKNQFTKTTADFNILEAELKQWGLIYIERGMEGQYWELSSRGLKVSGEMHREISKK